MKKAMLSIATVCYLVLTCGVIVNFHYCMNRLDSVKFFATASESCDRCGMDTHTSHGCCHDEVKVVKLDTDQQKQVPAEYAIPSMEEPVVTPSHFIASAFYNFKVQPDYLNHTPPILKGSDTYLHLGVFRI